MKIVKNVRRSRFSVKGSLFGSQFFQKMLVVIIVLASMLNVFSQELRLENPKALLYEEVVFVSDNPMVRGGLKGIYHLKDGALFFCVSLNVKINWLEGQSSLTIPVNEIQLTGSKGEVFPMIGSFRKGLFDKQTQGLMIWKRGNVTETVTRYRPVFAVPAGTISAKLSFGEKAEVPLTAEVAKAPNKPSFPADIKVIEARKSDWTPRTSYPKFGKKPSLVRSIYSYTETWTAVTLEITPSAPNNPAGSFTVSPQEFGLLQKIKDENIYTACAGHNWNKGISDIAEYLSMGQQKTMILYFGIAPLSPSAKLLYHGVPVADIIFSK